jgi:excisionase family DNA binding protein
MTIRRLADVRKWFVGTVESIGRLPYAGCMDRISVEIDKPWLTVADICEYMDVSTFVVTSVLRTGELRAVKFGREWRVAKVDFEDWINSQRSGETESVAEDQPIRQ